MKPIIILPPKAMSDEDIIELRKNGLCVVTAENPAIVKFVDPIPCAGQRTQIEQAAIRLSRIILNGQWGNYTNENQVSKSTAARIYVDLLIAGGPLDPAGTQEEKEMRAFDYGKINEMEKLGREEAKAARVAKKAADAKGK